MTQCQTFPTPEAIRAWANTTYSKDFDGIIRVQKNKLYHYFSLENGVYVCKMTSLMPFGE